MLLFTKALLDFYSKAKILSKQSSNGILIVYEINRFTPPPYPSLFNYNDIKKIFNAKVFFGGNCHQHTYEIQYVNNVVSTKQFFEVMEMDKINMDMEKFITIFYLR